MGTAIKHPVPDQVKPSFVIFNIRACWASKCPDVKNYYWRLNTVWHRMLYGCTHMATVGIKGLIISTTNLQREWGNFKTFLERSGNMRLSTWEQRPWCGCSGLRVPEHLSAEFHDHSGRNGCGTQCRAVSVTMVTAGALNNTWLMWTLLNSRLSSQLPNCMVMHKVAAKQIVTKYT